MTSIAKPFRKAALPAVLLTPEGHRLKINEAALGDTASLLFQTAFSGRAEMGSRARTTSRSRSAPMARPG